MKPCKCIISNIRIEYWKSVFESVFWDNRRLYQSPPNEKIYFETSFATDLLRLKCNRKLDAENQHFEADCKSQTRDDKTFAFEWRCIDVFHIETILFQLIADLWKFSLVCVHLSFVSFFHIWNRNEYSMTHNLWLTSKIAFQIFISSTKRLKFHFESAHLFSIFVHFRMNLFKLYFIATRFFFKIFTFFLK